MWARSFAARQGKPRQAQKGLRQDDPPTHLRPEEPISFGFSRWLAFGEQAGGGMIARERGRARRHRRIRKRVVGFPDRPRMAVFRSHKHLYVQVVNDLDNKTLLGCSTKTLQAKNACRNGGNIAAAQLLGKMLAAEATKRGIRQVVFDRGGYRYHGRVKALAEAARQAGLQF